MKSVNVKLVVAILFTFLVVIFIETIAHASHVGEEATIDQEVLASTATLSQLLKSYETAAAADKPALEARILALIGTREHALIHLLEKNPKVAEARLLSPAFTRRLPASAQVKIEKQATLAGSLESHVSDNFATGVSKNRIFLKLSDQASTRLEVHLTDLAAKLGDLQNLVGKTVKASGTQVGGHLVVSQKSSVQAAGGTTSGGTTQAATTAISGVQKTLAILVNFTDRNVECSAPDVEARLFGTTGVTMNTMFQSTSLGKVSFTGNAVGPLNINYASSGACDYNAWMTAAKAAAKSAGFDPAQYAKVTMVMPGGSSCGWAGLGYMPGTTTWVAACSATGVYAHELGHNLGFHHAATPSSEYGDGSDTMGGARLVQMNSINRTKAGWLPAMNSVQNVGTTGTHTISAMELTAPSTSQVLRINKPDTGEAYYVSLRQPIDIDAGLSAGYTNNVTIHRGTTAMSSKTYILSNLQANESFTDAVNGITITSNGVNGETANVSVMFGAGSCSHVAPSVSVSPASQTASSGTTLAYRVDVINNNSVDCGSTIFNIAQTLPSGFSGSFPTTLSLAPGASSSFTWNVSSLSSVITGSYNLDIQVSDPFGMATTAHAMASIIVDTTGPVVALTNPLNGAIVSGSRLAVSATASDSDSGVARVEFYDGTVLIGTSSAAPFSASWNLRKAGRGLHTVRAKAFDRSGNSSEVSVSVTVK